jgi:molecular chaperone GrpE
MEQENTETVAEADATASQPQTEAAAAESQPVAQAEVVAAQAAQQAEIDALKKDLAAAQARSSEYLDGWQRARAEFSNYKKRQEGEYANLRTLSTSTLVAKLLPVLDDFERASRTLPDPLRDMTWIDGVLLIQRKLQLILESEGVKLIEVKRNDEFNPTIHEAISHDEAPGVDSGHVIEEVQKGYKLGERVIRPSLVRVAR